MLLVNIFVMLADERRAQLGMLRAVGMRRRRVTAGFAVEASVYTGLAAILGAALGLCSIARRSSVSPYTSSTGSPPATSG